MRIPYKGTAILVGDFNTLMVLISLNHMGLLIQANKLLRSMDLEGMGCKIDYILAKDYANVTSTIIYDTVDGYFPSDHALMIAMCRFSIRKINLNFIFMIMGGVVYATHFNTNNTGKGL